VSPDKGQVESELESAWLELVSSVESVPEDEMETPGVVDEWSVKDLLGHITFWTEKAATDLDLLAQGRPGDIETPGNEENVNAWNKRESDARKGMDLGEIKRRWLESFTLAKAALDRVTSESLDTEVKGWPQRQRFAGDTYEHYQEHAEQIRAWQRALETTEA
jgi:hypothetical protein